MSPESSGVAGGCDGKPIDHRHALIWSAGALATCMLAACGQDVRLGTIIDARPSSDATPDGSSNPFTAGMYSAMFLDPPAVECGGALTGKDADFMPVTRASVGLVDGDVTFATPDAATLAIAGTPISSGWGQSSLALMLTQPDPPLWTGQVMADFGSGPDGTTRVFMGLAIDVSTAQSSSGIQAAAAVDYELGADNCTVTFGAMFTKL